MRYTFPRSEHLKSQKVIDRLFHRDKPGTSPAEQPAGKAPLTVYAHPFRVLYFRHDPSSEPDQEAIVPGTLPQVLFSVPKRAFKKAVDRNAVRRRVKEAYRLHKHRLVEQPAGEVTASALGPPATATAGGSPGSPLAQIVFLYTAKTKISFEEIEKGMKLALKKLV